MMNEEFNSRNFLGLCILAAAVVCGVFLVFRQIVAVQRTRVEASVKIAQNAPPMVPLTAEKAAVAQDATRKVVETQREVEDEDKLEAYEREERRPGLIQVFSVGRQLAQKKVEGVEFVKAVLFRSQVGTGRVLADVALFNDSAVPVTPRFQLMLFNAKGRFLCRDTVLYITEELAPGDKKIETMSLSHGPTGVAYYEFRKLD